MMGEKYYANAAQAYGQIGSGAAAGQLPMRTLSGKLSDTSNLLAKCEGIANSISDRLITGKGLLSGPSETAAPEAPADNVGHLVNDIETTVRRLVTRLDVILNAL